MIALIILGALLLLIALFLALRVRLVLTVCDGVTLTARVLCFSVRLHPRKRKRKSARKRKKADKKAAKAAKHKASTHKRKPTLRENLRLVRVLVATLIRRTDKHLTLRTARVRIAVATGDAASTAVLYGVVSQSVAYLLLLLDRVARVKPGKNDVAVVADFTGEKTTADVKLIFSMRVLGALKTALSLAIAFLRERRRQKIARRGAARGQYVSNGQVAPVGKE